MITLPRHHLGVMLISTESFNENKGRPELPVLHSATLGAVVSFGPY